MTSEAPVARALQPGTPTRGRDEMSDLEWANRLYRQLMQRVNRAIWTGEWL